MVRNSLEDYINRLGDDFYGIGVRLAGIALAIALWAVSMKFSVVGFQITSEGDQWIGWVLGLTITYVQILFNRSTRNQTIWVFGVIAYTYGLGTNIVGIVSLRVDPVTGASQMYDLLQNEPVMFFIQLLIVVGVAMMVEILPEHFLVNSLRDGADTGDFIQSLRNGMPSTKINNQNRSQKSNRGSRQQKSSNNNRGHQNQNKNKGRAKRTTPQPNGDGDTVSTKVYRANERSFEER